MARDEIKVFVYGTLKVGGRLGGNVKQFLKDVKKATVKGTMYSVHGHYPAVIFNDSGEIHGEVHTYEKPDYVLKTLDMIEGYLGKHHSSNLYDRKTITVVDVEGNEHTCYTYEFADKKGVKQLEKIENGVWEV